MSALRASLVVVSLLSVVSAQNPAYVPSNTPASGVCGTLPFGQAFGAGETYMARIPSSTMAAAGGVVNEVGFSGCGSGAWSSSTVIVGMGHLPSMIPMPFQYPTFDAMNNVTGTGSFLDFSIVYDSMSFGPLVWTVRQDAWSPMGLINPFVWNGADDVGLYITFQNGMPAAFTGAIRSDFSVFRTWASGYQAAQSTNSSTSTGMKMALNPPPRLGFFATSNPDGSASFVVQGLSAAAAEGWTFISTSTALPPGGGLFFGLVPDSFTFQTIALFPTPQVGNPLHWVAGVPGVFPSNPLNLPAGSLSPFTGQTWDFVLVALDGSLGVDDVSNLVRITWL